MTTCFRMRCVTCVLRQSLLPIFQSLLMPAPMFLKSREVTWSPCPQGTVTNSYMYLPKCHALILVPMNILPFSCAYYLCMASLFDFVPLVWRQVQSQTVTQPSGQYSSAHIQWWPPSMISSTHPPQHGSKQCRDAGYTAGMQVMLCHLVQHSYKCLINSANYHNDREWCLRIYFTSGVLLL